MLETIPFMLYSIGAGNFGFNIHAEEHKKKR